MKKCFWQLITIFVISLTVLSCDKKDESDDTTDDTVATDFEYFISGEIDGVEFILGFDPNPPNNTPEFLYGTSYEQSNDAGNNTCKTTYQPGIFPNFDDSLPVAGFSFNNYYDGGCGAEAELEVFHELFPTGSVPVTTDPNAIGVSFDYVPNFSGDSFYSSLNGPQSGSSFQIISSIEKNDLLIGSVHNISQVIEGTFKCTIYNDADPTDSLEITNGTFKLQVEAFHDGDPN